MEANLISATIYMEFTLYITPAIFLAPFPRSVYCAAVVASLTNIMEERLFERTADWVVRCQNWEGGLGGVPGMEAHGGYTFCGLAAMILFGKARMLDLSRLLRWAVNRQMRFEGGFQGRTNKLVDGCYSFWQAGLLPLLHRSLHAEGDSALSSSSWMFHVEALQEYLLVCCQCPAGGMLDKPGKARDFYHTCYCLSGLSVTQYFNAARQEIEATECVDNIMEMTHSVYNIGPKNVERTMRHFLELPNNKTPTQPESTSSK
uniref:protein farnesyltransferase subunit beta-like n=1 Tax=Myxine glutinosa TaxID=7769 RepID=UPI00358FA5F7